MKRKVLVIGGSGFIGSNLRKVLPSTNIDLKEGVDVCDGIYDKYDAIVFLAAHLDATKEDYVKNLKIYTALADYLQTHQPYVIYTSSAAVYQNTMRQTEADRPYPRTIYGESKLLGEQIIRLMSDCYTILRLSNVYGDGEGNGVVDRFSRGERTIYGDGKQVRDYVPVETVVNAILKLIESPKPYQIFNISSGAGMTVNEVFKWAGSGEPIHVAPRSFDIPFSILDNTRAKEAGLL